MKITKRVEKRTITLDELILMKESKDFERWRSLGKGNNFLMIFGGSPMVFYNNILETNWTPAEIRAFIKTEKLFALKETVTNRYVRESGDVIDGLTVATHMIKLFFDNYPGLMERIERNRAYAQTHGYIRTIYGATRILTELMLAGEYDKKENSKKLRNLSNIAANADIQNFESCIVNQAMYRVEQRFKDSDIDVRLFNNIHDSADFYVRKTDLKEFAKIVKEEFERDFPEYEGLPLPIDMVYVDKNLGHTYKHGQNF